MGPGPGGSVTGPGQPACPLLPLGSKGDAVVETRPLAREVVVLTENVRSPSQDAQDTQ